MVTVVLFQIVSYVVTYTFFSKIMVFVMNLLLCSECLNFINVCKYLKMFMKDQKRVSSLLLPKEHATMRFPGGAEYESTETSIR